MSADHPTVRGILALPRPLIRGATSLEKALESRESTRSFGPEALTLAEAAQLLWAAQGVNRPARNYRTAPSAGATFPLEVILVAGNVEGLEPGVYRYLPGEHGLNLIKAGDQRRALAGQALRQAAVAEAPALVAIAAVYERTTRRYGERGRRYVHMEVGHAGQNIHLQAAALGLGTVVIGAFDDPGVQEVLGLGDDETPLYLMPVGR